MLTKYKEFLKRFPTIRSLANAKIADVIRAWQGMGYNRRAVSLWKLAQIVVEQYGGKIPMDSKTLESLPGIGKYTARAIACFSYDSQQSFVDTNIRRVATRFFLWPKKPKEQAVEKMAERVLPPNRAYEWHHALMDFGATTCTSRPHCEICPIQQWCKAYPAVLTKTRSKKDSEPFLNSNRYMRGRIIDYLRQHQRSSIATLAQALGFPLRRMKQTAQSLERDGLLVRLSNDKNAVVTLP